MSRNGSGVYSLPAGNPVVTGTTISSSWANTTLSDIATALTGSVASDGQTPMTGNLQMGSNKVTGLAVATTSGDALSYGQAATVTDLSVTGNATVGGTLTLTGGLTLNGNVTVGDSSSDTLTVNATSTFAAGATFSSTFAANGGVTLGDASGDALTINSSAVSIPNGLNFDSNTFVIDATNNRVGVGTASPSNTFVVGGSSPQIQVSGSGTSTDFRINAAYGAAAVAAVGTVGAHPMFFFTNNTERMRIDSSGNVGIGTSSPQAALHVSKPAAVFRLQDSDGSAYNEIASGDDGSLYLAADASNVAGGSKIQFLVDNTARMTLDSSGNLGLGVTPSAWASTYTALQVKNFGLMSKNDSSWQYTNAYYDGSNKYVSNGYAGAFDFNGAATGGYAWRIAPSGTAGNAITFTQAMTLDASGNLGVGTSSPTEKLTVAGNIKLGTSGTTWIYGPSTSGRSIFSNSDGTAYIISYGSAYGSGSSTTLDFVTGSNYMRFDASGNLGLGVVPSAWGSNFKVLQVGSQDPAVMIGRTDGPAWAAWGVNFYNDNSNWRYINSDYASFYNIYADGHYWYSAPSGSAGATFSPTQVLVVIKDQSLALQGASSQTGTGITFPATQSASSNANTLDDYEEGTWTPVMTGAGSAPTITYTSQVGKYTKIGNLVYFNCIIYPATRSGGSGNLQITLPFNSVSGDAGYVKTVADVRNITFSGYVVGQIATNSNIIYLAGIRSANTPLNIAITDIAGGSSGVEISGVYATT